jgi:diadenylate cyclase
MRDVLNYLKTRYNSFGFTDALELLLIGLVIYFVYRSLRGTRGARAVRGFIFLLVTSFVLLRLLADYFQMERLKFLYTALVPVLALLAVIVFQPELRRSLMRLGDNRLFRRFLKEGASAFVDRIVRSAATLSRNRIGAIVAVEREARLGAVSETGTPVDAALTSDLLTTLFWPGSPLHDMGVIIQGGRIAAAGCEFPLSHQAILDPHLGTRHRAAVGLTEETDAVVVVVSEETGNISLAEGGQLEGPLTPDQLRDRLMELLSGEGATLTEHSLATAQEAAPPETTHEGPTDPASP